MLKFKLLFFIISSTRIGCSIPPPPSPTTEKPSIIISKCCKDDELMLNYFCQVPNETFKPHIWKPIFAETEHDDIQLTADKLPYTVKYGFPNCGKRQQWPIYAYSKSSDELMLLKNGNMRHYVYKNVEPDLMDEEDDEDDKRSNDYSPDQYCMDKIIVELDLFEALVAIICAPDIESLWNEPDLIMKRFINPIFHAVAICCFLIVAIVYFVLPQLCDLVGNIITTISVCLIVSQIADITRIFVEWNSEFSIFIADVALYTSLMSAFFWLTSMGYYIWNAFKSRSVIIRVTDGKKYCYYALYCWCTTLTMAGMAVFAHLFLDTGKPAYSNGSIANGAIGWLGLGIFFVPVAIVLFVNIFFCMSTLETMKRSSSHGRIHHKLRYQFQIFMKFLIIMTCNWFVFFLTWLPYDIIFYIHIFMNFGQSLLFFYVSIVESKRVRFLIRKACCYDKCICTCCRPGDPGDVAADWGEEMMAMNTSSY